MRKANIAINAEARLRKRRDIPRSTFGELGVNAPDQFIQWISDKFFINVLARLEPLALVVTLETAEECERLRGKALEFCWHIVMLIDRNNGGGRSGLTGLCGQLRPACP